MRVGILTVREVVQCGLRLGLVGDKIFSPWNQPGLEYRRGCVPPRGIGKETNLIVTRRSNSVGPQLTLGRLGVGRSEVPKLAESYSMRLRENPKTFRG